MTKLQIYDETIDKFNSCNPLEITCLDISTINNNELILNNLHKFKNLQKLQLCSQITEIKGINNLVNLQQLILIHTNISEIKGLDNLVNLQILHLYNNKITKINGLDSLVNLQELNLYNNHITEINGLDKLVNLQILNLYNNHIKEIKGLDNLVNLQHLFLYNNQIKEIKGLDNLVNLQQLVLGSNYIKEIKGLDNLNNLLQLNISNSQILEINGLDNLVNLQVLDLIDNKITEIKGLGNLVNLQKLDLSYNNIREIKGLDNLVNLKNLYLYSNQIIELPLNLCNFRNIYDFNGNNNPIEYIPFPVQRWLNRNRNRNKNNIYNDDQNVHNHTIQASFRNSLTNLLKDKTTINLETVKNEIINNEILTEQTKREIINYCDDPTEHSTYLITYSDLLIYVWSRIRNNNEILTVLNQEISDGLCMCFTGRMTRLLNVLVGFYDDIELQISDSEQITNIIMSFKNKYVGEQLKDAVKKELIERQYSEAIINEWLEYI